MFLIAVEAEWIGRLFSWVMPAFPHSNVLLISADAVHSLLPPTLISKIGALLELNKIDQAVALAEQHRKRVNRDPNAIDHVEVRPKPKNTNISPVSLYSIGSGVTLRIPTNRLRLSPKHLVRRCWQTSVLWRPRPSNPHQLLLRPPRVPI